GRLRQEAVGRVQFAHQPLPRHLGRQAGPDPLAVARPAAQRYLEVVPARHAVLEQQQRPAAGPAPDQVQQADAAEARSDDRAAVAVAVGPGQVADVEEVLPLDVQEGAVALVGAEVVAVGDDLPGVADPELAQRAVQTAGQRDFAATVARL